ncbi:hypothetical protein M1L60_06295 [Actinoplanes sp. TRM 88003]|uniref:Uncharacterized protein n=1 Tax=Paractinoplanes aksuensis TaxID=2939490 RepID=A0ABT1DHC9_9ACTN|nr:hypothetical protein [Actinoplanes aksuensis]MCO8270202.1 hypothetical protein [Actinoplanes aksuensis]
MHWTDRLGGPPGRYAVTAAALTAVWFLFRLWLDHGDPVLSILGLSGLYGALWGLGPWLIDKVNRRGHRDLDRADRRRGVVVGLGVGLPLFGALLAMCLATGRWVYATGYVLAIAGIVIAAWLSYRKERTEATV